MFLVDTLLLVAGALMIVGILSSKLSARAGLPVLVVFLGVGMLAGSDGLGGIHFDDHALAHGIGTVALTFILFDGGLRTPLASLQSAWRPAAALATAGVLVTSVITGLIASLVLPINLFEAMLLGSIVGSTDAAAVFALLRGAGVHLRQRVAATLEIESGANDPMAVFLTVAIIEALTADGSTSGGFLALFVLQMGVGLTAGFAVGRLAVMMINSVNLASAGLYPVLTAACGVVAFGLAATLGGSGFLAVYVAGLVMGNSALVFQRGTLVFHDGIASASQIAMFVVLGLLSYPSQLPAVAGPSLLVAAGLTFLARPLAVALVLRPFGFSREELGLISWVGLKGAVPIILATYPLMAGLPSGQLIFNVVFFVVLVSALVQGTTLPWLARRLDLEVPPPPEAPLSLEIMALRNVDAQIIDYVVAEDGVAAGRSLRDLALPEGVVVALITRGRRVIPPRGSTRIAADDHLFLVVEDLARPYVDVALGRGRGDSPVRPDTELRLRGTTRLASIEAVYGLRLGEPGELSLESVLCRLLPSIEVDSEVEAYGLRLRVREVAEGRIISVGLRASDPPQDAPPGG